MYTHFFNLKQSPFSIAPDPRYLFMSERHREALAHLLYGVGSGGGFVLLTGEIGAGKTTVCRCFMEQIPENCQLAYIFNPKLSVEELLHSICEEFRVNLAPGVASVKGYVDAINTHLLASHAQGKNNVLIIDEAQNLSAAVLEQLRLLTNLETSERKLLQIILIGQPELRAMLARPELEQLAQRVIARYHLGSLTPAETGAYIAHRLAVAGATAMAPFPPRLIAQVHQLTKGVPRRINLLCDRALLGAYVENSPVVTRTILRRAAAEVFVGQGALTPALKRQWPYALLGLLAGVAITGALGWRLMPHGAATAAVGQRGQSALLAHRWPPEHRFPRWASPEHRPAYRRKRLCRRRFLLLRLLRYRLSHPLQLRLCSPVLPQQCRRPPAATWHRLPPPAATPPCASWPSCGASRCRTATLAPPPPSSICAACKARAASMTCVSSTVRPCCCCMTIRPCRPTPC